MILLALPLEASELFLGGDLPSADVFILGEQHDHAQHHKNQATLVAQIEPAAIVFEMLTPDQALRVADIGVGDEDKLEASLEWNESGWPDFAMYYPIFTAAPNAKIYGAALSRAQVRAAIDAGAAAVFGADAELFGLTVSLRAPEQDQRETLQMTAHCNALPKELLPGMVEAQRLRDAHFARVALGALAETNGPVVVIAGNGHARADWGMTAAIRHASSGVDVISIGQVSGDTDMPFDFVIKTDAFHSETDPCAGFKTN